MSWIFSAIIIFSIILIGNKNRWGWMVANIGALGFIWIYIPAKIYGGIALDCVLLIINTRNFIKWSFYDRLHREPYSKPFYLTLTSNHTLKVNDILKSDLSTNKKLIVTKINIKDKKWKKFFRSLNMTKFFLFFGININDHTGCIKIKPVSK